jgi:antitoxin (DNA-binding transcriptional repressor) of toxin-antitoxin stability system
MKTASVRDIRQKIPAVMHRVEEGENVAIAMRRKIVARLIPERPPITRNKRRSFQSRRRLRYGKLGRDIVVCGWLSFPKMRH